ncbi:hypothetical protein BS78_06G127100 [Paspalum vaginatum]|nr:hypothetical protein BS78_06G127100 [Paspalum vaginatum]
MALPAAWLSAQGHRRRTRYAERGAAVGPAARASSLHPASLRAGGGSCREPRRGRGDGAAAGLGRVREGSDRRPRTRRRGGSSRWARARREEPPPAWARAREGSHRRPGRGRGVTVTVSGFRPDPCEWRRRRGKRTGTSVGEGKEFQGCK